MTLYDKIITIYPELTADDFLSPVATITLFDNATGKGPYIKEWKHPKFPKPTQEQLDAIKE